MIRHHPEKEMLLEYAAGTLPWAQSLAVKAHLEMCPACQQQHQQLNGIGGTLLGNSDPQPVAGTAFDKLMQRIDRPDQGSSPEEALPVNDARQPRPKNPSADPALASLPRVVGKLVAKNGPLKWRRVSPALKMTRLKTGQDKYEVAFHRICRGGRTAEHDHRGQEIIMVLHGAFSDADGFYRPGDFLVRNPGEVHRPIATEDQECLCLSVVEAPVSVTGVLGWLVNPFLGFRPG